MLTISALPIQVWPDLCVSIRNVLFRHVNEEVSTLYDIWMREFILYIIGHIELMSRLTCHSECQFLLRGVNIFLSL